MHRPWLCTFFRDLLPPVRVNGWVPNVGGEQGFVELVLPPAFFAFGECKAGGDGLGDDAEALLVGDVLPEGRGGVRGVLVGVPEVGGGALDGAAPVDARAGFDEAARAGQAGEKLWCETTSASVRLAALLMI